MSGLSLNWRIKRDKAERKEWASDSYSFNLDFSPTQFALGGF